MDATTPRVSRVEAWHKDSPSRMVIFASVQRVLSRSTESLGDGEDDPGFGCLIDA